MDIWIGLDVICALVNICAFNYIGAQTPAEIHDVLKKEKLDYYIIMVLILSWLRFFSYFLVVNNISKLTITLGRMIKEAVSFMIITVCYFLIATTVFAILFRNSPAQDVFGTLPLTFRWLFDLAVGNINPVDMGPYTQSYSIFKIIHIVIANIFLINFLVAII